MRCFILAFALILACQPEQHPVSDQPRLPYRMPNPSVPSNAPLIETTLLYPLDTETANSLSIKQFVEPIANSTEGLRLLTWGGGIRRRVTAFADTVMTIEPLGAVMVNPGAGWKVYSHTAQSVINPKAVAPGGVFNASTRYYVYAYESGAALAFIVSVDGPDAGYHYKNGDPKFFYVSTFCTDGANHLQPYVQTDNVFRYYTGLGSYVQVLTAGNAIAPTSVPLGVTVPTGARDVILQVNVTNTAANEWGNVRQVGGTGIVLRVHPQAGAAVGIGQATVCLTSTNTFEYDLSANTATMDAFVLGFTL